MAETRERLKAVLKTTERQKNLSTVLHFRAYSPPDCWLSERFNRPSLMLPGPGEEVLILQRKLVLMWTMNFSPTK